MHAADAEKQTARALAEKALCRYQGSDNVSVVVIRLSPPPLNQGFVSPLLHQQQQQQPELLAGASAPGVAPPAPPMWQPPPNPWGEASKQPPLSYQGSQESVTTADPCSPGRHALQSKLKMRFIDAYPPSESEDYDADAYAGEELVYGELY